MHKTFSILLLLSFSCAVFAQETEEPVGPRRQAYETAQALKQGTLIVVLPSHSNKIKAMKAMLDNPSVGDKDKERIGKQLETTMTEGRLNNRITIGAFREFYRFSEVYFAYDTATTQLRNGITEDFFLNDSLEVDEQLSVPAGKAWFTLRTGYMDAADSSGAEAFILSDRDFKELPPPFPGAVRLDNVNFLINRTLAPEIAVRKRMGKAVKKLEERLRDLNRGY